MRRDAGRLFHSIRDLDLDSNTYRNLDSLLGYPEGYLLVGKQGNPDFSAEPQAVSSVTTLRSTGGLLSETRLARPKGESAARYLLAHKRLVAPLHAFLIREGRAAQVSRLEGMAARLVELMAERDHHPSTVAHAVYPSRDEVTDEIDPVVASALFVSRNLAHTNHVEGSVPEYSGAFDECDIDLVDLVAQERRGIPTSLGVHHSVAARALGVIGLLAGEDEFHEAVKFYPRVD